MVFEWNHSMLVDSRIEDQDVQYSVCPTSRGLWRFSWWLSDSSSDRRHHHHHLWPYTIEYHHDVEDGDGICIMMMMMMIRDGIPVADDSNPWFYSLTLSFWFIHLVGRPDPYAICSFAVVLVRSAPTSLPFSPVCKKSIWNQRKSDNKVLHPLHLTFIRLSTLIPRLIVWNHIPSE